MKNTVTFCLQNLSIIVKALSSHREETEMDDKNIVALYWERSENAIVETEKKYGRYCHYIARNILRSEQDAEECVNDTYRKAWETIPPKHPEKLSAYLGTLTRNIALSRYVYNHAEKRSPAAQIVFDEVEKLLSDTDGEIADEMQLRDAINSFVGSLEKKTRQVFVRRYWYMSSVKEIARDFGMTESNVKVMLMRTRIKFKKHLESEGIVI